MVNSKNSKFDSLKSQSEWLRITISSIGDGVIATSSDGRISFLNGVAESLTGWSQPDAEGKTLAEVFNIVDVATRTTIPNPVLRALDEGVPIHTTKRTTLIARDGSERSIEDSASPVRSDDGNIVGALLVFRDVTEKRKAEEVHARLAAIVEDSQDAIISKSLAGIIQTWNEGAHRIFGYTAEEAVGKHVTIIIPHERLNEETAILDRLRRGEHVEHFETVRRRKDGEYIVVSLTVSPIRNSDGAIIGASKIARNITDRKSVEAALAALAETSEKRKRLYETALSTTPDLVYVFDLEHRFTFANETLLRMWGKTWDEAIGKNCLELGYEAWHAAMHDQEIDRVIETKKPIRGEVPFTGTAGKRIYDYIFVPVFDATGQVEAVAGTTRDITDRQAMEQELRDSDRRKDEFIALLAHELRNPLAPIRNGLQIIRLAGADREALERARSMMDRQLTHMVRLIDDLLDISRISRNKMELRRETITLADVIASAVETARPTIEKSEHELTVSLPAVPVFLEADLTRLAQVFSNLLTNSAKYTPKAGHIVLSAERHVGSVMISVSDNGIGIPEASLPSIFDMFCQVDRSIERSTGGLGIGLALVKGLVEMHSGTVVAESPGEGRGSTFQVTLPTVTVPDSHSSHAGPKTLRTLTTGKRILVVDDNRDGAESLAEMLVLLDNEVRTAHDGIEAVKLAESFLPDIVLMDVGMPKMNGYEATRRIRSTAWGKKLKIIALTGWGQDEDREQSRIAGCDGHLVKPVNLEELDRELVGISIR